METHLGATERHLPYRITHTCQLSQVNVLLHYLSRTHWYSIYLPARDGRLSWQLDSESTRSQPSGYRSNVLTIILSSQLHIYSYWLS